MLNEVIKAEIKELSKTTNKTTRKLNNYFYKCYSNLPHVECNTQFENEQYTTEANNIIIDFLRDYAHFNEDNSKLLKNYNMGDDELFNCCSPYRL